MGDHKKKKKKKVNGREITNTKLFTVESIKVWSHFKNVIFVKEIG